VKWPAWWEWELELSPHVGKRMEDRGFVAWEVIVEPDYEDERLVIVTAYGLDDLK
jgi:hypothetical protein